MSSCLVRADELRARGTNEHTTTTTKKSQPTDKKQRMYVTTNLEGDVFGVPGREALVDVGADGPRHGLQHRLRGGQHLVHLDGLLFLCAGSGGSRAMKKRFGYVYVCTSM